MNTWAGNGHTIGKTISNGMIVPNATAREIMAHDDDGNALAWCMGGHTLETGDQIVGFFCLGRLAGGTNPGSGDR